MVSLPLVIKRDLPLASEDGRTSPGYQKGENETMDAGDVPEETHLGTRSAEDVASSLSEKGRRDFKTGTDRVCRVAGGP